MRQKNTTNKMIMNILLVMITVISSSSSSSSSSLFYVHAQGTTTPTLLVDYAPCLIPTASYGANKQKGNCPDTLISGNTCQPTCAQAGYTISGVTQCTKGVLGEATCEKWACNNAPVAFLNSDKVAGEVLITESDNHFCAIEDTEMTVTLKASFSTDGDPTEPFTATYDYELLCPPARSKTINSAKLAEVTTTGEVGTLTFMPEINAFSSSKTDLDLFSFKVTRTTYSVATPPVELTSKVEIMTGRIYIEPQNDLPTWPADVISLSFAAQEIRPNKECVCNGDVCGTNSTKAQCEQSPWGFYDFETFQSQSTFKTPTSYEDGTATLYNAYILKGNLDCIDTSELTVTNVSEGFIDKCESYQMTDLDKDGDYLRYEITTQPKYGQIKLSCDYDTSSAQLCAQDAGAFVYIPFGNNSGLSDTFSYTINDLEAGGHDGLDPPTNLPVNASGHITRGMRSATRQVTITVAEKTFLPSITSVKEVVATGGSSASTIASIREDEAKIFTVVREPVEKIIYNNVKFTDIRVYTAQNSKYNAVTDIDGYETVEFGRIKWECWDTKCAGAICAPEISGNKTSGGFYTCDCVETTDFTAKNFWQSCEKVDADDSNSVSAHFTYIPNKDKGDVEENLWFRIGVADGIEDNFNRESGTVLITVKLIAQDDVSELSVYGKNPDGEEVIKTLFIVPMTVAETFGKTKSELEYDVYAAQWTEFKIVANDEDKPDELFLTLKNIAAVEGAVTDNIAGVQSGNPTMGKDTTSLTSDINILPFTAAVTGNPPIKTGKYTVTIYYRAKEYFRGPMDNLTFGASQSRESSLTDPTITVSFISRCSPGHTKNAIETKCSPCGFGEYAELVDMNACSPCAKGTYTNITGSVTCSSCDNSSYQPEEGKSSCTLCPARSTTEGGAITQGSCLCQIGTYGNLVTALPENFDTACTTCPGLGSRCVERGLLVPEAQPGYFIDLPDLDQGELLTIRSCTPVEACPGNATDDEILADSYPWKVQCEAGYEEKGCAQCSKNYYRSKQNCEICPDTDWESYVLLIAMLVGFIMLLPMLVKLLRRFKAISLLFVFVQITAVLADLDFKWPPIIQNLYKYFAIFTFDIQLLQPECHIPKFDFFTRYFVVVLSPLFFGGVFVLITLAKFAIGQVLIRMVLAGSFDSWLDYDTRDEDDEGNKRGKIERMKERMKKMIIDKKEELKEFSVMDHVKSVWSMFIRIMLTLMDISYIFLSRATLEYFDCVENPANGISYLESQPGIKCYDWGNLKNPWTRYFPIALALVIIYPFGIIVAFYFTLYRIREKLNRPDVVKTFGFLYVGYRPAWYRYKILVLLRQLGVVMSTMLFSQETKMSQLGQSLGCIMTIFVAMTIHFFADPQESKRLDRLESAAIFVSFINIFSGLIFLTDKASAKFDDFLSYFNAVLILGALSIFVIYISLEVFPFVVKSVKSSPGISGVIFGDVAEHDDEKKTTKQKLEAYTQAKEKELQKRLSTKISLADERQASLSKGPSLYKRVTFGSKRDYKTPEELRKEARSKFIDEQIKKAAKNVLDKKQRDFLLELPVEEGDMLEFRTEYVNPETNDQEFTELNKQGVDVQAQWVIERHLPPPFTKVHAVDILKRVNDLLDRARRRQKTLQGVNMLGSLKPSGMFSLIRKGVIARVADNLIRIRLISDDEPNDVVSKLVTLATEESKSLSWLIGFYKWAMKRIGFNVEEDKDEKKTRLQAAIKGALLKQQGAGNLLKKLQKQQSAKEGNDAAAAGESAPEVKKLSLIEKIKIQQEKERAAEDKAKAAAAAAATGDKEDSKPAEEVPVIEKKPFEKKPSAFERLRSLGGRREKEATPTEGAEEVTDETKED
jgi:hypothetical protein